MSTVPQMPCWGHSANCLFSLCAAAEVHAGCQTRTCSYCMPQMFFWERTAARPQHGSTLQPSIFRNCACILLKHAARWMFMTLPCCLNVQFATLAMALELLLPAMQADRAGQLLAAARGVSGQGLCPELFWALIIRLCVCVHYFDGCSSNS